ncbi:hypothetical protein HK100_009487 [Physocladia obscura]|uniref:Uncharacterized protein n=1 Tax=Physocladia obscura TaxID=109957 RepID=A0AAD5T396_9FUNG|nr:hypothetical protein HK100_009487 [Physocladia obscura]
MRRNHRHSSSSEPSTTSRSVTTFNITLRGDTASGQAAIQAFQAFNVPYIAYNTTSSLAFSTLPLTSSLGTANFSMLVLGSGVIGFSAAQWSQLYAYQNANNVRLVSLYDVPGTGASASYTNQSTATFNSIVISPNNIISTTAAGLPATYSISFDSGLGLAYLGQVVNSTAVTPILTYTDSVTKATAVAACVYNFSSTQQQLSFFYQIAAWNVLITTTSVSATISSYTDAIWISWVSNGVYAVTAPVVVPAPTGPFFVNNNALIIATSLTLDIGAGAAVDVFTRFNVPYVIVTPPTTGLFSLETIANSVGNYSMIVLGSGGVLNGQISPAQWSQLRTYQNLYRVKIVSLYDVPSEAASGTVGYVTSLGSFSDSSVSTYIANASFAAASGVASTNNLSLNGFGTYYPAAITNTSAVTPFMYFTGSTTASLANGTVAACVFQFSPNVSQLSFFYAFASWSSATSGGLSNYSSALWLDWVSNGNYTAVIPPAPPLPPVVTHTVSVQARGLILAPGDGSHEYPEIIFQAYGLDYDVVNVTAATIGTALTLEITANVTGKYSVIVLTSGQMIAAFTNGSYLSTLYSWQYQQIYNYQQYYGVRLVTFNDLPTASVFANKLTGADSATGCSSTTSLSISPVGEQFTTPAGMKSSWSLIVGDGIAGGSCNFPASILNGTSVTPVLDFGSTTANQKLAAVYTVLPTGCQSCFSTLNGISASAATTFCSNSLANLAIFKTCVNTLATCTGTDLTKALSAIEGSIPGSCSVAAAVIDFGRNQQQMSFFFPMASWSITCDSVAHIWFQWATYGLFTGFRRLYFTPQVDDMFLTTSGNNENGIAVDFRLSPDDMQGLIDWQPDVNARMPSGSNITFEIGFNGNGVMEIISTTVDYTLDFDPDLTDTALNWKKPLGTGLTLWPALNTLNTTWGPALSADRLYSFFAGSNISTTANKFLWTSHTFTHEILNNNSYSDTINELTFNFRLASKEYLNWDGQEFWNNKTMITPGISGLFNGDALRALSDFGIKSAVGDSSRPQTMNADRPLYWPLYTTMEANGFDGFIILPRQVLNIYFNCTNQEYDAVLYNAIYKLTPPVNFYYILNAEVQRNMRTLALLSWQPVMFHQGNLRNADLPIVSFGSKTGKLGLAQQWIESVFGNFTQLVNWPILTVKQDDLTQKVVNRMIYETANVTVIEAVTVSATGVTLSGFTVSASTSCIAPVTLPLGVAATNVVLPVGATTEQIGVDALTIWIPLVAGATPVSVTFKTAVAV